MTGAELKAIRLNNGDSIRGLARKLDLPEQTIRRLEEGKGCWLDRAKKLADYYGVQVTDLPAFELEVAA